VVEKYFFDFILSNQKNTNGNMISMLNREIGKFDANFYCYDRNRFEKHITIPGFLLNMRHISQFTESSLYGGTKINNTVNCGHMFHIFIGCYTIIKLVCLIKVSIEVGYISHKCKLHSKNEKVKITEFWMSI
jgi:hypothetical protein